MGKQKEQPHCLRGECGWYAPGSFNCLGCGWWSTEAERRQELPLKQDPETGLYRKFIGKRITPNGNN